MNLSFRLRALSAFAALALLSCGGGPKEEPLPSGKPVTIELTQSFIPVYEDALASGWSDWSWATHNLANPAPVSAGADSISVTYGPWTGLNFTNSGVALSGLDFLDFKVDEEPRPGPRSMHASSSTAHTVLMC